MKGGGGQNVYFCPRSGYKNCPRREWGSNNGKIECPHTRSYLSANDANAIVFIDAFIGNLATQEYIVQITGVEI